MKNWKKAALAAMMATSFHASFAAAEAPKAMKAEAAAAVDAQAKQVQVMVDQVFSYAEPGFQEFKTTEYLTGILEKNGFKIERGVAGIPTAFTATWGEGGPLIALGSDIDDVLGVSQMPGVPNLKPIIAGAPGHGEGHNAGMPLVIAAALAAKKVMEEHKIPGRLMLWPTSPWQPTSAPEIDALRLNRYPIAPAVSRKRTTPSSSAPSTKCQ